MSRWELAPEISDLADQLGVGAAAPVDGILDYCRRRIDSWVAEAGDDSVFAFQLAVYAAAGRGEGLNVSAAYLHQLKTAQRLSIPIGDAKVNEAKGRADVLIDGIVQGKFPAQPEKAKYRGCDMRGICKHAKGGM